MHKRLLVAALIIGLVAFWFGWLDSLGQAWRAWADGRSMSGVEIWGRDLRFWERSGKFCILISGLLVGLDIVDPATLRDHGRHARLKLEHARTSSKKTRDLYRLHELKLAIAGTLLEFDQVFVTLTERVTPVPVAYVATTSVRAQKIGDLTGRDPRISKQELEAFHNLVLKRLPEVYVDEQRHEFLSDEWKWFALREAESLLAKVVTTEERSLLVYIDDFKTSRWANVHLYVPLTVGMILLTGILPVAWLMESFRERGITRYAELPVLVGFIVGFGAICRIIAVRLMTTAEADWLVVVRALRSVPTIALSSFLARLLDRARPGHVLRWWAFYFFIAGSHFDILST